MIEGFFLISNSDAQKFYDDVSEKIKALQNDGKEVEIQYSTDKVEEGNSNYLVNKICHSALIIGRKK